MGLNTIETYVPWNLHEPHPGEFVFTGLCDVESFIRKAAELGLYVIVRPGPYICAEWDNGGLPAWLNSNPELRVRCMNRPYLDADGRQICHPSKTAFRVESVKDFPKRRGRERKYMALLQADVQSFIRDQQKLEMWSKDFFREVIRHFQEA